MSTEPESIADIAAKFMSATKVSKLENVWLERLHCPRQNWRGETVFDQDLPGNTRQQLKVWLPELITHMSGENLYSSSTTSLLAGLGACAGGEHIPKTEHDAHALAFTILYFISDYMDGHSRDLAARPYICDLLNAWIQPAEPWKDIPGARTVCRHLFGDAWCALILPETFDDAIGSSGRLRPELDSFVINNKPAFLPGLFAGPSPASAVTLPESLEFQL